MEVSRCVLRSSTVARSFPLLPIFLVAAVGTASAAESAYTATTTLFSDLTHTQADERSDTRGGLGVRGDVGAQLKSGAHSFDARYGATVETERSDLETRQNDDSFSIRGASRYDFFEPGNRFDFNAGHTIRSVRNDTGFAIDSTEYDTQNAVSAGGGVWFYPSAVTNVRLSGQAGKTWEENERPDGESAMVAAALIRRATERSNVTLNASRSWEKKDPNDITLDAATIGMDTRYESGTFAMSIGQSRAESDDFESDAVVGSISRDWLTDWTSTRISYDRSQTSDLLDLALAPIPEFGIEDEFSIRVQGLTIRDTVNFVHSTRRVCDLCTVRLLAQSTEEEEVSTGDETWEYLAGVGLGLAVDELKTVDFDYLWQGDAFSDRSSIDDEIHRFIVTYRHQLTELVTWGTSFDTAVTRGTSDRERYRARVFVTLGWDGVDRDW